MFVQYHITTHVRKLVFALLMLLICQPLLRPVAIASGQSSRPNIILINVDDLDTELFETGCATQVFPNLRRLAAEGVKFSNCHVASPLCGPSRASLLTGLYVHRHGFRVQQPMDKVANGFDGGFRQYQANFVEGTTTAKNDWTKNDISRQMQNAGYRTMLVGKYLHGGFSPDVNQRWSELRPEGWDDFYCTLGGRYYGVGQYLSRRNGEYREEVRNLSKFSLSDYAAEDQPYLYSRYRTNVEIIDAISLIQDHQVDRSGQPFFMYLAPFAPHLPDSGSMLDNRYQLWWKNLLQPHSADFNVAAGVDKPEVLNRLGLLTPSQIEQSNLEYRSRLLAMKSFDDMLGLMLDRLNADGTLDNTIIMFTSDNGYMEGHQRHFGKQLPYDRCTRVPLVVWGPNSSIAQSTKRAHLVSHVDFVSTLLELANVESPAITDGQSLAKLLRRDEIVPDASTWRPQGVLSEHYQRLGHAWQDIEGVFVSLRTDQERLTQWGDGLKEFYNLSSDPYELENQFANLDQSDRNLFENLLNANLLGDRFISTVGIPEKNFQVFRSQVFSGYAVSPLRVREVRLVFRRLNSEGSIEFLNGEQWSESYAQNKAVLLANSDTISRWNYQFQPDGEGEYPVTMTARAYGQDGSFQQQITERKFVVEHEAPGTSLNAATGSQILFNGNFDYTISGTAKGILDIREVRLVIKNQTTGEYFDGQQWKTGYRYVLAKMQTFGDPTFRTWTYTLPASVHAERIYLNARAYQIDGKYDKTIPWVILKKK